MGGGGGGGKESSSFGVIEYGTPQRGRVWEGVLFGNLGTKNQAFGCVINVKLTSNLARNVYDCSTRGGGGGGGTVYVVK